MVRLITMLFNLAEPTTGMDPVNRRHVWSFIEKFKEGRVIVLTTHSMEEADVVWLPDILFNLFYIAG